jgi:hypothetical protein
LSRQLLKSILCLDAEVKRRRSTSVSLSYAIQKKKQKYFCLTRQRKLRIGK